MAYAKILPGDMEILRRGYSTRDNNNRRSQKRNGHTRAAPPVGFARG